MLEVFLQPASWVAIATLALLEVVLGIDNLVFIAILTSRAPKEQRKSARQLGLAAALVTRLLLLASMSWIASLTQPLVPPFSLLGHEVAITGRGLILFVGGMFLIYKSVGEMYHKVELKDEEEAHNTRKRPQSFWLLILNIALMDIIFSLDSVITAVGMVGRFELMAAGVIIAMIVMIAFANPVSEFINSNPSLKILALAFLLMIGTLLIAEARVLPIDFEFNKGYVYFAMVFSLIVEFIEMRYERNVAKVAAARSLSETETELDV